MIEQALDVRGFLGAVRRRLAVVIAIAALGLLAGISYTLLNPPLPTGNVLVLLPPAAARSIGTQVVVAASEPVLAGAVGQVNPPMTLQTLRSRVRATSLASGIVSIRASGQTAAQAKSAANAVAASYIAYVGRKNNPVGALQAGILSAATDATQGSLRLRLLLAGLVGVVLGTVIGVIAAFALGRNRRPLRKRSEIASASGVPVLASMPVSHPSSPAAWASLLELYRPAPSDAQSLRRVLHGLGPGDSLPGHRDNSRHVLRVFSLASDPGALAVGPQLAVFAASSGIRTTLIIGTHEYAKMSASLRTAYSAARDMSLKQLGMLNVGVLDGGDDDRLPAPPLAVIVNVVSSRSRLLTGTTPSTAALLAVSAGAATGEQLARMAARIATNGQPLVGAIVANPDAADSTSGRASRSARPAGRLGPHGQAAMTTEIRL